jgi:hypothetical protein
MSSQAQLQSQITAIDNALQVLRQQLAVTTTERAVDQQQLFLTILDLERDRERAVAELANLTVANNPPNPQVSDPVPVTVLPTEINREPNNNLFVFDENNELLPADSAPAQILLEQQAAAEERRVRVENTQAADIGGDFIAVQNPETQKWDVFNLADPNVPVATGLGQADAELLAQDLSIGDPGYGLDQDFTGPLPQTQAELRRQQQLDAELDAATIEAANQRATLDQARQQAAIRNQQKSQAEAGDWRVRLRLAPGANYLYNDPQPGILEPLSSRSGTDGVIFPYTPSVTMAYHANYTQYDLTHSNYRGYFYQNSYLGEITMTATFTAQDTSEANYLLAVIHFFRSVTKMFYGQDTERGAPPPMVFLQGLGEFQFNLHPCLVRDFNYTLPTDVDYIRARSPNLAGANLQLRRDRDSQPTNVFSGALERLRNAGLPKGGINIPPAPPTLGVNSPTYVPTKLEMTIILLPIQTRQQVSQQFGLRKYSNGNLLKGGFW